MDALPGEQRVCKEAQDTGKSATGRCTTPSQAKERRPEPYLTGRRRRFIQSDPSDTGASCVAVVKMKQAIALACAPNPAGGDGHESRRRGDPSQLVMGTFSTAGIDESSGCGQGVDGKGRELERKK